MLKIITGMLLLTISMPLLAQMPTPEMRAETKEAMQRLDFLVGAWQGEGWIARGRDQRDEFEQTERIRTLLDGDVILIEGRGLSADDEGRVIHDALAVLSYNSDSDQYAMRAFVQGGRHTDADVQVGDETLIWQMGSNVRYSISLDQAGRWYEIGEYSRDDGQSWFQFFEMTLDRRPPTNIE